MYNLISYILLWPAKIQKPLLRNTKITRFEYYDRRLRQCQEINVVKIFNVKANNYTYVSKRCFVLHSWSTWVCYELHYFPAVIDARITKSR